MSSFSYIMLMSFLYFLCLDILSRELSWWSLSWLFPFLRWSSKKKKEENYLTVVCPAITCSLSVLFVMSFQRHFNSTIAVQTHWTLVTPQKQLNRNQEVVPKARFLGFSFTTCLESRFLDCHCLWWNKKLNSKVTELFFIHPWLPCSCTLILVRARVSREIFSLSRLDLEIQVCVLSSKCVWISCTCDASFVHHYIYP